MSRTQLSPKVSIVIPVFNGAQFLSAAIDSALQQTYPDVEVLVVDDGSRDRTKAIALGYGDRVRYIEQENLGLGAALNAGIEVMAGEFFCWLSHDDVYKSEKIERQAEFYQQLERDDVILFTDYETIDAVGDGTGRMVFEPIIGDNPKLALWYGCVEGSTIFAPRSAFDRFGRFDENIRSASDYDLWMKWCDHLHFIHIPESLVKKRVHANQLSATSSAVEARDRLWQRLIGSAPPAECALLSGSSRRFFGGLSQYYDTAQYPSAALRASELADATDKPLVTVVMAVLNELELAERAIHSVLMQSYPNIEVIVVVDKSASGIERLTKIMPENPNVRVLYDDGRGAGAAKNLGIELASGEYIAFLDHDDWFMPTKIARQVSEMIDEGYLVSHTSYLAIYPSRNLGPAVVHSGRQSGMLFPSIMSNCQIAATTAMIHRAVAAAGFRYAEDYDLGADSVLWAAIAREYPILGIDVPLTLIEWSDDTAAINLRKQRVGLTAVRDAYVMDPVLGEFPDQIAILSAAIDDIDAHLEQTTSRGSDSSGLNEALMATAFGFQ